MEIRGVGEQKTSLELVQVLSGVDHDVVILLEISDELTLFLELFSLEIRSKAPGFALPVRCF